MKCGNGITFTKGLHEHALCSLRMLVFRDTFVRRMRPNGRAAPYAGSAVALLPITERMS